MTIRQGGKFRISLLENRICAMHVLLASSSRMLALGEDEGRGSDFMILSHSGTRQRNFFI